MTFQVKQRIKGKTYVYEVESYWDHEKKQSRQRRKYLGTWDENSQKIIPRDDAFVIKTTVNYGDVHILRSIATRLGIEKTLGKLFGEKANLMLTLSFFKILEPRSLRMFGTWAEDSFFATASGMGKEKFTSQYLSRFLEEIADEEPAMLDFFRSRIGAADKKSLIYDITSLSSNSKLLPLLEYGYNRNGDALPQVNLGLVVSKRSALPVYYKIFPGSINDVSTLEGLLKDVISLGVRSSTFILDRGFCSEHNLLCMLNKRQNFIMAMPLSTKTGKELVSRNNKEICNPANAWRYGESVINSVSESFRIGRKIVHACLFFDEKRKVEERENFFNRLMDIEKVLDGKKVRGDAERFVKKTAGNMISCIEWRLEDGLIRVERKPNAISQRINRFGKLILVSRKKIDRSFALSAYREKDEIEKQYMRLKNDMEALPMRVRKEKTLRGLLFIFFISMIIRSRLLNLLRKGGVLEKRSVEEVMTEAGKLRAVLIGEKWRLTEVTKTQREIFEKLGINTPVQART
jgi:transposase